MRILLVANTLPPHDVSGVGEQVLQLATGLRERGHEVRVLGRGSGGDMVGARGPKLLFPLTVVSALSRAVREFDPDVVQVHEGDVGLGATSLRRRRGARPRPLLVALQQGSYVEERRAVRSLRFGGKTLGAPEAAERRFRLFKAPLQIALGRRTARAADLLLAPSRATAAELERDYGVRAAAVLPNVTGKIVPERQPAGAGESGFLLFVGRLRIRKGVEVLLEALARSQLSPPPNLVVAGEGEHRAALERRAADLGLATRVRFAGRASAEEVAALLGRAAALVVPSIYEGMPLVVLEAMAARLPVIASRVSGIPEVVVDGETGWLIPPEDPPALAATISTLYGDPREAGRRGAAGAARVEACYRPRHAAALWESIVLPRLASPGERAR